MQIVDYRLGGFMPDTPEMFLADTAYKLCNWYIVMPLPSEAVEERVGSP